MTKGMKHSKTINRCLWSLQLLARQHWGRNKLWKTRIWITVTVGLLNVILLQLSFIDIWYVPLRYVDSPNRLEDYFLWWSCLFNALFLAPLCFLAARKTVRLHKGKQWLSLSELLPMKVTCLAALVLVGLMVAVHRKYSGYGGSDVPEYGSALGIAGLCQTLLLLTGLVYVLWILVKQLRRRAKNIAHPL